MSLAQTNVPDCHTGCLHLKVTQGWAKALAPWKAPHLYRVGTELELVSRRRKAVTNDASYSGSGVLYKSRSESHSGKACSSAGKSTLEMMVFFGFQNLPTRPEGAPCLGPFRQYDSGGIYKPQRGSQISSSVRSLHIWAQCNLHSLKAVHMPGRLNQGADRLSQSGMSQGGVETHTLDGLNHLECLQEGRDRALLLRKQLSLPNIFSKEKDALAHKWPSLCLYAFPHWLCSFKSQRTDAGSSMPPTGWTSHGSQRW